MKATSCIVKQFTALHPASSVVKLSNLDQQEKMEAVASSLSVHYKRAICGIQSILVFGWMMERLGVVLARQNNSHGPQTKGDGLKNWLTTHCPEINYKTAYEFYLLSKKVLTQLGISPKVDIQRLLESGTSDLTPNEIQIKDSIEDAISGKSMRSLQVEFGIRKAIQPSGGAREGAGRPAFSHTREQMQIDDAFSKDMLGKLAVATMDKRWHLRIDQERQRVLFAIAETLVRDLKKLV